METPKIKAHIDKEQPGEDPGLITNKAKKVLALSGYDLVKISDETGGVNPFPEHDEIFWTDAQLDANDLRGRERIAASLGIKLSDIVSFTAANHTNEVVVVDTKNGIQKIDSAKNPISGETNAAGWSEPILPSKKSESLGAERGTYDGIILVGRDNFEGKYLLATGADCTPVGVRGLLMSGEEFIAIAHGGRKGTMKGIMENLSKRLQWLGVRTESIEVFVGPAAQSIENQSELLEKEASGDNSYKVASVSAEYQKEGELKVLYNNQFDTIRRLVESLKLKPEQVHLIDADTVSEDKRGKLHSFRRDKTPARNSLVIGFSKKV